VNTRIVSDMLAQTVADLAYGRFSAHALNRPTVVRGSHEGLSDDIALIVWPNAGDWTLKFIGWARLNTEIEDNAGILLEPYTESTLSICIEGDE
jgi:hypothetical protein